MFFTGFVFCVRFRGWCLNYLQIWNCIVISVYYWLLVVVLKSLQSQFCETFTTLEMTQCWTVRKIHDRPFLVGVPHLTVCHFVKLCDVKSNFAQTSSKKNGFKCQIWVKIRSEFKENWVKFTEIWHSPHLLNSELGFDKIGVILDCLELEVPWQCGSPFR